MSQWIIDASSVLGWFLPDEDSTYDLDELSENGIVVPTLWMYEVSNGLLMAHRRQRLSSAELIEAMENLGKLPVTIDRANPQIVLQLPLLALKFQLTVYDAAYLELAMRLQLPIATNDKALQRAMTSCGVASVQP